MVSIQPNNRDRVRILENWMVLHCWILLLAGNILGAIPGAGTHYLDFREGGAFSFEKVSILDIVFNPLLGRFLAPALFLTLWFIWSESKSIRRSVKAAAVLSPVLMSIPFGGPIRFYFTAIESIRAVPRLIEAIDSGASHSGEWWGQMSMFIPLGLFVLWSFTWVLLPLAKYWDPRPRRGEVIAAAPADPSKQA